MGKNLYQKVFEAHTVRKLEGEQYQVLMGLHLLHEVTSPQAFSMMEEEGLSVSYPERTFATADHIIPTDGESRPYQRPEAEAMLQRLEENCKKHGIRFFSPDRKEHGIVHVIGPENGITQPGMTICCGDSHTSTHGAFGAIAFGIGSSQVKDVLTTQSMVLKPLKVRRILIQGELPSGVYAKDLILHVIRVLGAKAGVGYAYEFAGSTIDAMSMEERMTICNMAIEGGARCGYVNPDETTYEYLKSRKYAPDSKNWEEAIRYWDSIRSDSDAKFDDEVVFDASEMQPSVTWGIHPDESVGILEAIPQIESVSESKKQSLSDTFQFMGMEDGQKIQGRKIDVAFIGSCTNGRYSDLKLVADLLRSGNHRVAPGVKAMVVPGSESIRQQLVSEGIDRIYESAGFSFREPGCSMCLAMNPDKLEAGQVCASSSNRNFKGRQGSPTGKTLLMSPVMVAAAAVRGVVSDAREVFGIGGKNV